MDSLAVQSTERYAFGWVDRRAYAATLAREIVDTGPHFDGLGRLLGAVRPPSNLQDARRFARIRDEVRSRGYCMPLFDETHQPELVNLASWSRWVGAVEKFLDQGEAR